MNKDLVYLSIDKLIPHPKNPRKNLGDLTELSESIKVKGVMQNLTVVPGIDDTYNIIIGHRRHAASKLAGLTELPCVIECMSEAEQVATMLLENIQRIQQVDGINYDLSTDLLTELFGNDFTSISNYSSNRANYLREAATGPDKAQVMPRLIYRAFAGAMQVFAPFM